MINLLITEAVTPVAFLGEYRSAPPKYQAMVRGLILRSSKIFHAAHTTEKPNGRASDASLLKQQLRKQ